MKLNGDSILIAPSEFVMVSNSLKSDIQPVLSLRGYGIHIPFLSS